MAEAATNRIDLPVLPLRDVVVYPHMVIPLFVGREKSIRALDVAMEADKQILLVAQKSPETDDPEANDLYEIGPWRRCCSCSSSQTARSRCWLKAFRARRSPAIPSARAH
jgi:ATP-dependent Lon protease